MIEIFALKEYYFLSPLEILNGNEPIIPEMHAIGVLKSYLFTKAVRVFLAYIFVNTNQT
jgi:hypothetical protein